MAATLSDSYQISQDPVFQNRIQSALLGACVAIANEGWNVVFHRERATFSSQILSTTVSPNPHIILFTNSVSTDPTCLADATAAGTVVLTPANRAAQAALITDAHINNAVSAQFNSFIRLPAS